MKHIIYLENANYLGLDRIMLNFTETYNLQSV